MVDQDLYLQINSGELFVTPAARYAFGTGLGGVTWLKATNTEQTLFYIQFPDIVNLKNPAFVDLVGRFIGELFVYYCTMVFLFWNRSIRQKIFGEDSPLGKFAKHAALVITWSIISLPFLFFRYGLSERSIWIPDTFSFNEYYYAYSSITYRALLEFMMFVPSTISQELAIPTEFIFEPFPIFIIGALLTSIFSLLSTMTLRLSHNG